MRPIGLALALLAFTVLDSAAADRLLVARAPYVLAPYDSLAHPDRFVDRADYDSTRADSTIRIERVTYRSDSLTVAAYVAAPSHGPTGKRPGIVFVRGSWTVRDIGWQLAPMFRRLVRAGFVVIAPLLRGSDGAPGRDEMGGADLADLMCAPALARELGSIDLRRLYLYGESRGGMMVLLALRDRFPACAAATYGAFTDLEGMVAADTTHLEPMARMIWPSWPTERAAIAARRSAQRWPERLRVPLLLMQGTADRQVPPTQAPALAAAVRAAGGRATARLFDGAGHTLRGHEAARDSLAVAWFRGAGPCGLP